jgi:hypothetical protein
MKNESNRSLTCLLSLMATALVCMTSCSTTSSDLSTNLPDGYEIVALALDEDEAGELPSSGKQGFTVTVTLNKALPSHTAAVVPFMVRDKELIQGAPLAISFVPVAVGSSTATYKNAFYMECDDGEVAGRTGFPGDLFKNLEKYDRSSGERSTKIFVQYGEELRTIFGITTGVAHAVESNRIRVSCPK